MTDKRLKILLAEDDINLGFLLVDFLEMQGFEVKLYKDGQSALAGFHNLLFDFCLLDIMLPKLSGYELAEKIREKDKKIPIVFLTAKSEKYDKIKAYRLGVDDYITKPFDEDLLVCKIQAIAKRVNEPDSNTVEGEIQIGSYNYDSSIRKLFSKDGESRRLTSKENDILKMLCCKQNQIVEREMILKNIWGENDYFTSRSLDVFISKLRKYFRDDSSIKIENIPSLGLSLQVVEN